MTNKALYLTASICLFSFGESLGGILLLALAINEMI